MTSGEPSVTSEATCVPKFLTRKQAAAFLQAEGYPVPASTLATMATRGGGPAYSLFGRHALYAKEQLLEWAQSKALQIAA